jgi:hypothetical protein
MLVECCVCKKFMGYKHATNLPMFSISHGYCTMCKDRIIQEIRGEE